MIKTYIHGESTDKELFESIGRWALSKDVHATVGMAITSEVDDIWFVSFERDRPVGFSQVRRMLNNNVHLRYLYAESEEDKQAILEHVVDAVTKMGASELYTNDRESEKVWPKHGFKKHVNKRPGEFVKWEKVIQ